MWLRPVHILFRKWTQQQPQQVQQQQPWQQCIMTATTTTTTPKNKQQQQWQQQPDKSSHCIDHEVHDNNDNINGSGDKTDSDQCTNIN
jgi:hypothetical protein